MSEPTSSTTTTRNVTRVSSLFFVGLLAIIFILDWGPGSLGNKSSGKASEDETAATVNGQPILLRDFVRMYGSQLASMRQQGSPISEQLARQFGLPKQVLDRMVADEVVAQAAEARGLTATDSDLLSMLKKDPSFQKDGAFNRERYHEVLRDYLRRTEVDYETDLRRRLSANKLEDLVASAAAVSDDEVRAKYEREGNKAAVTFVRFNPAAYAAKVVPAKPAELEKWASANEALIRADYERRTLEFQIPERIRARQILVRAGADSGPDGQKAAKAKIDQLRQDILSGKDFAELAKASSDDTETKAAGGDLGWVERSQLPPALSEAAFGLKTGEVTEPVKSALGWHLARVEDKKAPETQSFDQVKKDIAAQVWIKEKAKSLARADADKALAAAKAGKKLTDLFPKRESADESTAGFKADTRPEATETGDFNATAMMIPSLGASPEAFKAVFDLKAPGLLDTVFAVNEAPTVILVTSRHLPSDVEFLKEKEALTIEAIKGKQYELRESFKKALRQSAQVTTNDKALKPYTSDTTEG